MNKELNIGDAKRFSESFSSDPRNKLAMNAVTVGEINDVALNHKAVVYSVHSFSHVIKTATATAQGATGRCWIFAGMNTLRIYAMKKLNMKEFELSQAYMMFWDKLEKANYFLENIIETRDEPRDGRLVMHLLGSIIPDAGQWDMLVNLIKKYGVVPKKAMPETKSSMGSRGMNGRIIEKLRECAKVLRDMNEAGASVEEMRSKKEGMLETVYRMLCIHLGEAPREFYWQWTDKDDKFHREGVITPKEFYKKYIDFDLDSMVCLINAPTKDKPYNRMYTVDYLGNVVGGHPVRYLNVDIESMKKTASQMVKEGKPVWFGCDSSKMSYRTLGVYDPTIYDYGTVYNTKFDLDKAGRLDYKQSQMTHAMVFVGVDIDDEGKPRKWRVENSGGPKAGNKGFYMMTDAWFNEYMYEVMVDKKYLSEEHIKALETEPIHLKPWDPMGALAQ